MSRRSAFSTYVLGFAALVPAVHAAQSQGPPLYEVEALGQSAWGLTIANDVNNHGVVVGEWDSGNVFGSPRHAVAWIDGQMIDLTTDGAISLATANSVNDDGLIVGRFLTDGSYPAGGFTWQDGVFQVLPTFAAGHQSAAGVSESGLVVGRAMHEHFSTNATLWTADLEDVDLGELGQGLGLAYDANGWDNVVGSSGVSLAQTDAFLWRGGKMHSLGTLSGDSIGRARAINNYNEVVGFSGDILDEHPFYWTEATGMIDLGDLGFDFGAAANDINDAGVIVGYAYAATGRVGALWHDFVLHDLNDLLVNGAGWEIYDANGVNELGQIVGHGRKNGTSVAYLLTPVEPLTTAIGPSPARAGEVNTVEVLAATPNAEVRVYFGASAGHHVVDGCAASVDIASPASVAVRADATGRALARFDVPANAQGHLRFFQAVDVSTCDTTNLIVRRMD